MTRLLAALALAASLAPTFAEAQNADRGFALARRMCGVCHAVAAGASPNPDAPNFREISRRYEPENLEEALAEGIGVGHSGAMPEFQLPPRAVADLIAYLERLRRAR
jgi:mono/diheme cytochrome c family protein